MFTPCLQRQSSGRQAGSLARNWLCCRARIQRRGKTRPTPPFTLLIGPACRRVQLCGPHCFLARCTRIHGPPDEEPNRRSVDFAAVARVSRASEASVGDVILPATQRRPVVCQVSRAAAAACALGDAAARAEIPFVFACLSFVWAPGRDPARAHAPLVAYPRRFPMRRWRTAFRPVYFRLLRCA